MRLNGTPGSVYFLRHFSFSLSKIDGKFETHGIGIFDFKIINNSLFILGIS